MYYQVQNSNSNNLSQQLFDVNRQIASGQKFEYAYEAPTSFADTMRLDNEINTFKQVSTSANSGLKFSQQTDSTISSITATLDQLKTKLIQAGSAANSPQSMQALAGEMRGLETQLKSLANTSINGQYIFSGSMVNQKPIDANGNYLGNDQSLTSFLGSNATQAYNVPGSDMFLGQESTTKRVITTNVQNFNQSALHPDIMTDTSLPASSGTQQFIAPSDTIRDLMGASTTAVDNTSSKNHFYIAGTKHDGSTFKTTINMNDGDSVQSLLDKIGQAYGNTSTNKVVSVNLNAVGQIEIQDNLPGSSKLDFHMVANINPDGAATDLNDLYDPNDTKHLNDLNCNGTHVVDFTKSALTSYTAQVGQQQDQFTPDSFNLNMDMRTQSGNLATSSTLLKNIFPSNISSITLGGTDASGNSVTSSFTIGATSTVQDLLTAIKGSYGTTPDFAINMSNGQINFSTATGATNGINIQLTSLDASNNATAGLSSNAGITYDNAAFTQSGNTLLSNVPQIVKSDNSYATNSTKLSDVAGTSPFAPQKLKLSGTNINGTPFNAQIDIKNTANGGSTFSLDGGNTNYTIYNTASPRTAVDGNDMTYKQLTDVVNMIVSSNLPAITLPATTNSDVEYDAAIKAADFKSTVSLDAKGQIQFEDKNASTTKANISFSDANSTTYPASGVTTAGSSLEFNANSSLTISDPKTDFFASIDAIISSVEQGKYRADSSSGDLRNAGIQNGIQMIDNLDSHISKEQSKSGVQSQSLQAASDRAQTLTLNAQSLRSNVTDTDIAQATLQLSQLQLNYQAIYSTISKVSQLSLVNYIK
jgi:flagellar hook-associated protein 3 FlgL